MSKSDGAKHKRKTSKHSKAGSGFLKVAIIVFAVLIVLLGGLSIYANNYKGIYPNTTICGVDVSNLNEAELRAYINGKYTREAADGTEIPVSCEENRDKLCVKSLNVSFDNEAFVQNILNSGRDGNFAANTINFIKRRFVSESVEPVVSYDKSAAVTLFDALTEGIETQPVGHTFVIGDDKVTVNGPVSGYIADREKAFGELENRIKTLDSSEIVLRPEYVKPEPLDFDAFYDWLTSDAENAYYEKIDGVITVHPSKAKVEVGRQNLKDAIERLKTSEENSVDVYADIIQPEVSEKTLKDQLFSAKLSSYSTNFGGSSAARANNVKLAASRIDGTELMPDEEFSYDNTILPRTSENGYMAAPVYVGNKVESGMGGGICQPSSTLYAAALYANLEILERHNHSMKVGYITAGIDATIAQGYLDLRFKNTTGYPIKISASANGGVLTFTVLGYNPDNTKVELVITSNGNNYYVTRVVKQNGIEIKRESMRSSSYVEPEKTEEEKKAEEKKKAEAEEKAKKDSENNDEKNSVKSNADANASADVTDASSEKPSVREALNDDALATDDI